MTRNLPVCPLILVLLSVVAHGDDGWQAHTEAGVKALRKARLADAERHLVEAVQQAERFDTRDSLAVSALDALSGGVRISHRANSAIDSVTLASGQ